MQTERQLGAEITECLKSRELRLVLRQREFFFVSGRDLRPTSRQLLTSLWLCARPRRGFIRAANAQLNTQTDG